MISRAPGVESSRWPKLTGRVPHNVRATQARPGDSGPVSVKTEGEDPVERSFNPWLALLVLCLGTFVVVLDLTIVNVAIPALLVSLGATLDQVLWVVNAYLLTFAVLLITAGRLGDILGQRNLFVAGLGLFAIASAACGLARDPTQLIAARAV